MDWKDEEVKAVYEVAQKLGHFMDFESLRAIMTHTIELAAARGGTMTAAQMMAFRAQTEQDNTSRVADDWRDEILAHVSTQGARVAVLEQEKANLEEGNRLLAERLSAAEEGNRELVRRAQQAESKLEHATQARDYWRGKCATLSAVGQGPINQAGRTIHAEASGEVVLMVGPIDHYPCATTCTHDDAATPGHPERVKERSEAVTGATEAAENLAAGERGLQRAYDNGAEAMRAACWEAVQQAAIAMGLSNGQQLAFKSAIEGAGP